MRIVASTVNDLYCRAIYSLCREGHGVSPRGKKTVETIGSTLVLQNPAFNVVTLRERNLNYQFQVAEWLWIMFGRNDVRTIAPYNGNISQFSDDGMHFFGAYGPKVVEQLQYVVRTLKNDRDSRQAVINLWRERPAGTRDIPCTLSMQFLIRHDLLHTVVTMRSNDIWLGFPYDIFTFTQIQRYLAVLLGVGLGSYTHNVGSLHLYEEHFEKAQMVAELCNPIWLIPEGFASPPLSAMPPWMETFFLGITAQDPNIMQDLIYTWERDEEHDYNVWLDYLKVLAYRFHKRVEDLPALYRQLYNGLQRTE